MRDFFFLQYAQQLGLHADVDFADFVEKERALVGNLEQSFFLGVRPGERAFLVAEQFRFEQVFVDRCAIDGLEAFADARAGFVNGARDALFAGARFAANQHR